MTALQLSVASASALLSQPIEPTQHTEILSLAQKTVVSGLPEGCDTTALTPRGEAIVSRILTAVYVRIYSNLEHTTSYSHDGTSVGFATGGARLTENERKDLARVRWSRPDGTKAKGVRSAIASVWSKDA